MRQSISESRDAVGRTTVALHDDVPALLYACVLLGVTPVFFFGEAAVPFVLANILVFGSLSAWFTYARRRMQVTVDAAARTLAVGSGPKQRLLALHELQGARVVAGSGRPGTHRVELVLRSGEALPLYVGLGGFREEDCRSLVERIQALLSAVGS